MTPQEFKAIRIQMKLTQSQMAEWLKLSDGRVIRSWESGQYQIPGSVIKCLELAGYYKNKYNETTKEGTVKDARKFIESLRS